MKTFTTPSIMRARTPTLLAVLAVCSLAYSHETTIPIEPSSPSTYSQAPPAARLEGSPKPNIIALQGVPDVELQLIWVRPGVFTMGSPVDEEGYDPSEKQRVVELGKGFYLGEFEVTQAQYSHVMGNNPSDTPSIDPRKPVNQVSWYDARRFCVKLTELEKEAGRLPENMSYRLPNEAQWEYACRAGTTTAFWWGVEFDGRKVNCNVDGSRSPMETSSSVITPAGKFPPNPWGFHDMHGNVYEWCADDRLTQDMQSGRFFTVFIDSSPVASLLLPEPPWDLDDFIGMRSPYHSSNMRGGGFWSALQQVRSAYRHAHPKSDTLNHKGFRVALRFDNDEIILYPPGVGIE